ncbi:PREDICTED: cytochrome P450 714C2-like [Nelumbo nucifera]|uniref:Cytochrome P450 714C2-like n=1 Tax=Nelumbo nucifera TaxID=4432 RepID=A0A1U7ZVZ9_NELNU|nr:PREDICTED: cytochrome P450 714C2-like [Nelumbo nucifera]
MGFQFLFSLVVVGAFSLFIHLCNILWVKPQRIRCELQKQGICGPPPSFLLGNIREMKAAKLSVAKSTPEGSQDIFHNCSSTIFPFFHQWSEKYGRLFMFSLGKMQLLYVSEPNMVKEISQSTSLDLGKPSYQQKELGPLLGQGIITSNGAKWAYQRKIIAPELHLDKVKSMVDLMEEPITLLLNSWKRKIEGEGGIVDIRIDEDLRIFSGDVISRACFGSSYSKGKELFLRLRALQEAIANRRLKLGIPGLRYLPTNSNRNIWGLEKEIHSSISRILDEHNRGRFEKNLLQIILDGSRNGELGPNTTERFIVDNCKSMYLAGYETTAISATWSLMLLASHPEWQARVRAEILQVCGGQLPNVDILRRMKLLTMVIQEALRLYPPVGVLTREVFKDMKFGEIHVPKGAFLWIAVAILHQDPEFWGADANKFNPERFINGSVGACKFPHLYMPFGFGPRICLGQNLAMLELKMLLARILSEFSFSLSPKYCHSPVLGLVIEPEYGVNLLVQRL